MLGQRHAENELLKKAFAMAKKKVREERVKRQRRTRAASCGELRLKINFHKPILLSFLECNL
jgi:hypothetical protein